ncbi:MAG: 2-(1,2-epoxy-1,2-dihydrophenyl)acetyl-CoA isomerase [Bdellovibrio sp. CG12_big_fil_rev_8_21_14_0_65_39_13]|nr:MAG: 2-(1,2-epoxy-1,2-dihydrophenyl)acetyl-CoA isomerase [Bdellovibrio sp. CG22_combo_CG10-13_8_21_14_all_39_27]PIQ59593.1 MAG: 2-(1,2-epoxy-1,2-dihydrophenyl)acetyl-CoA isomerase [Bdellovibrio sp. CG12_big_fil_rev_8_21_14_0_65_39_13]PIR33171.1 MAG: 2-(1,2-epoxy-1,2-dihydrophenyl)acetyl-CoA isomerase [Bdellovibrio sp. CG11_big_fil_rev_8_21_14_0_20_39_38]
MSELLYSVENSTALIKINRPTVFNALNRDSKLALIELIKKANADSEVKTIILTAEGKAFCSGQDLNDRTVQSQDQRVDLGHTLETEWNPLVQALRSSEKIVIGAINGVCAGAGVSVAMACDLIVAHAQVKFVSGFSKIGLIPDAGSNHVFVRALGRARAMEFFLFNQPMMAEQMHAAGLINAIDENPLAWATKKSAEINAMAPIPVKLIKKNLNFACDHSFSDVLKEEIGAQRTCGNSDDYQEGLKAFFEKRPAVFKGK